MSSAELKREQSDAETVSATPAIREHRSRELGLDQLFEVLQNQRRRYVLNYLREHEEVTTLSDLSEQIAAWENDKEIRRTSLSFSQAAICSERSLSVVTSSCSRR